jgi:hypothetical protein
MITGILTMRDATDPNDVGGTINAGLEDGANIFKLDVVSGDGARALVWLDREAVIRLVAAGAAALMDM